MTEKKLVGDAFLDRIITGNMSKNPEYNPKTKKGSIQPPTLVNTNPALFEEGIVTRYARNTADQRYTGRELGFTNDRIKRDADLGISLSRYNTEDELNLARAHNQSNWAKVGNALVQAGVGEVLLGTLEGFGNIADGIINSITGSNYGKNPYTAFMEDAKNKLKEDFQIYQEHPEGGFNADLGWVMNGLVSAATTASLMLPAAGWARGLSALGKIGNASTKLSRWASRGIAKAAKSGTVGNKFGTLRSAAMKANRMERTLTNGTAIVGQALLSRTGENYMEAKAIYDDVYTNSKENLDNMPDEEFAKFLSYNPEFAKMDKDEIAKEIARKSANTTFWNDYAMLFMDIPQFKALGKLWGRQTRRATTAAERIAAENTKRTLAGKTGEELIKDNIWNRTKEGIKYALKNPKDSFLALELGEGFEEIYQGIQTEKGMEVAEKYFNPKMTSRSLGSYLSDETIWEQGFWGVVGGIAFNKLGKGIQAADKAIRGAWNKKHMSAEDYEKWKRSNTNIAIQQLNNITTQVDEYLNEMKTIENGENPYNVIKDPTTGREIIKNGEYVNETINEEQKSLLREKALSKFIDNVTMDSIDNGTLDLMKEVIGGSEFDQYITNNGGQIDGVDKTLGQEVISRMDEVSDIYENELKNVDALADTTNPFITKAVARNITRNKLKIQEYDDVIANINQQIDTTNDTNLDFNSYRESEKYKVYKKNVDNLIRQKKRLGLEKAKGNLTEYDYQDKVKQIDKAINTWNDWAQANTTKGALEAVRQEFNEALGKEDTELQKAFDKFVGEYEKAVLGNKKDTIIPETIEKIIADEIAVESQRNYAIAQTPSTAEDYEDIYNEFSRSMDAMELARRDDYLERVKNYLASADDINGAIKKIENENTGNKKVDEALRYLRYRSDESTDIALGGKGQFLTNMFIDEMITEEQNKRDTAKKANEEVNKEGIGPLPEADKKEDATEPPSTGGVQKTETKPVAVAEPKPTNAPATKPEPKKPIDKEGIDLGGGYDQLKDPSKIDTRLDTLDESYDTPSLKAEIKARQYVMQVGFKNPSKLDEITKTLAAGDLSKRDEFYKEVYQFLRKEGFDDVVAKHIAVKSTLATIDLFGAMNKQSAFGRLAQQLAIGFTKKNAETMQIEDLTNDKGLASAVEEFLDEYNSLVDNTTIGDGKQVINLESLFDYILNDSDVDVKTAMFIYNNLSKYIAKNDGSKYIFTGYDTYDKRMLSAVEFINQLKESKAQLRDTVNKLHISPIELRQRSTKESAQEYREALEAAHNGIAIKVYVTPHYTTIKEVQPEGFEKHKSVMSNLDVIVQYKKGKKIKNVKVGILRAVKMSGDGNRIYPIRHQSGFANVLNNTPTGINLDCDFLFNAIINRDSTDGKQLWEDIANYYNTVQGIIANRKAKVISLEEARKALEEAMTDEMADRIMNNSLIRRALLAEVYKFDVGVKPENKAKARDISSKIASILFFGREDNVDDPTNINRNRFATDKTTLAKRYEVWKEEVKANYEQTANLQSTFPERDEKDSEAESDGEAIISRLNVSYTTMPNIIEEGAPYKNIKNLDFEHDPTAPNYTPFVYVKNHRLIGEDGVDYGEADPMIGDYSMGFITYKDKNVQHVAYFKSYNELKDEEITTKIKEEIRRLIMAQLNNIYDGNNAASHEETFAKIGAIFNDLFGYQGLFRLGSYYEEGDLAIKISNDGNYINIYHNDRVTKQKKPLIAFFAFDDKGNRGHGIKIFDTSGNNVTFNSINGSAKLSKETINNWIDYAINEMTKSVKLNRSALGFTKRTASFGTPTVFDWNPSTNEFNLKLGGKTYKYKNYADFVTTLGGFNVNVYQNEDGSFVTRYMNENRITADTAIREETDIPQAENHAVTDMLYTSEANPRRKTADTKDILAAAGVEEDKIKILLGDVDGIPLATKRITISPANGDAFLFYNMNTKSIHITPKGAFAMNGNPANAIRLIIHENIHRHFNSSKFTNAERQRIVTELQSVYDYVRAKMIEEHNRGNLSDTLFNQFNQVLDDTQNYADQQTRMEEFLAECLSQGPLTGWLNDTEYNADVDVTGINKKNKSILQKIIDILLDLLGINTGNIKKNSILAREYVILSKGINSTTTAGTANAANTVRKTSPVEGTSKPKPASDSGINTEVLNRTKVKIDTIITDFEARITRSPNFTEDHKYLIDGKEVDTSVTQKIHGKVDIGDAAIPSTTLGNTADVTAREYFENDSVIADNVKIPNVNESQREELINSMTEITKYLDGRHGKGKYRVITREFPIGGTVTVNGEVKTIAGTMDMVVYTDTGDIYIYDFKTKRFESDESKEQYRKSENGKIVGESLNHYTQQVNIYRQLLEENYPELKGKVHIGGLIKFSVSYPLGKSFKYRPNPKDNTQLQISINDGDFVDIQDSPVNYLSPVIGDVSFDKNIFIPIEEKDYGDTIGALPEPTKVEDIEGIDDVDDISTDELDDDYFDGIEKYATTEQIVDNANSSAEIYAPAVAYGATDNAYGVRIVNSMDDFINQFPTQYQPDIKLILDSNELNYTCQ